jgi:hypothetical protein
VRADTGDVAVIEGTTTERASTFTRAPVWLVTVCAIGGWVALVDIGLNPAFRRQLLVTQDPLNPPDTDDFLLSSPLPMLLARLFGAYDRVAFKLLHLAVVIVCVGVAVVIVQLRVGERAAKLLAVAWFCSPLAVVLGTWLGTPDAVTMLCATALVVAGPVGTAAAALLLGFNHFEQGVFVMIAAGVIRWRWLTISPRFVWSVVAFLVGRMLLQAYLAAADVSAGRAGYISERGVGYFASRWAAHPVVLILGGLGVLWVPLGFMLYRSEHRRALAALIAFLSLPVLITLDVSRVQSLLLWPVVVLMCVWYAARDEEIVDRWVWWLVVTAAIVPRFVLWDGAVSVHGLFS